MLISFKMKFSFLPLYSFFDCFPGFSPFFMLAYCMFTFIMLCILLRLKTNTVGENVLASDRVCTSKVLQRVPDPWNTLTNFLRSPSSVFNQLPNKNSSFSSFTSICLSLSPCLSLQNRTVHSIPVFINTKCLKGEKGRDEKKGEKTVFIVKSEVDGMLTKR